MTIEEKWQALSAGACFAIRGKQHTGSRAETASAAV